MRKEDKAILIEKIKDTLARYSCVYLTETTALNAEKTVDLRRAAFKADILTSGEPEPQLLKPRA